MQLRKCCNHPFLIKGVEDRELEELGSRPNAAAVMEKTIQCSGKMVLVSKLIPKLKREGHKILIFSQFLKQLDLLQRYCESNNFGFERLDGSTGGSFRQNSIDRFSRAHSKSFIFLLSTKAGGVGINLIAADTVIIFDSDWNPMNDLQAQARCHRIGQKKSVQIYRLVTRNTYESQMFDRASQKLGLEHAVLGTASFNETTQVEKPSAEQLVELLKRGAYALMEEDDTASKQFAERDIETILKENATVRVVSAATKNDEGDDNDQDTASDASAEVPNYLQRKSPSKKRVRKSLGGMAVDRSSFVAEGSTGELAVDDPNFWEKVLPGAVSVEMLSLKLEDGSAVSSRQSKIKFISNLEIALDNLVSDLQSAHDEDNPRFSSNVQHEYDIAIQVVHAVTSKYRQEFSNEQLDLVKKCMTKLDKSRVRRSRVVTSMRKDQSRSEANGGSNRKRKMSGTHNGEHFDYSSLDESSHGDDDDEDASPVRKMRKKTLGKRGRPRKHPLPDLGASPARGSKKKAVNKVPSETNGFVTSPLLFQNGAINDSDDLCTLCGDGGLILLCDGPCHRSFHLECVGMDSEPDEEQWLCPDCTAGRHMCLICMQVGEMGVEFGVIQCSMSKCGRFYHKGCLLKHPRVEWVGKKRFRCPSHFCHGCGSGGDDTSASAKNSKSKSKTSARNKKKAVADDASTLVSCIHCAKAYHPPCVKTSDKLMRLSKHLMICASHLEGKSKRPAALSSRLPPLQATKQANGSSDSNGGHLAVNEEEEEEIPIAIPLDDDDTADSAEETPKKKAKKAKRVSIGHDNEPPAPPVEHICALCHRGKGGAPSPTSGSRPEPDGEATPSKKGNNKRTADDTTPNGDAHAPASAGLEGPFIDAPVRLVYSSDRPAQWVHVHLNCALHSPEVYVEPDGLIMNLDKAVKRGRQLRCSSCRVTGATIGCVVDKCKCNYHLRCAIESGGEFVEATYSLYCKTHAEAKRAAEATCGVCRRKEGNEEDEDEEPAGKLELACATCRTRFHANCVHVSDRLATRYAKEGSWKCSKCSDHPVRFHAHSTAAGCALDANFVLMSSRPPQRRRAQKKRRQQKARRSLRLAGHRPGHRRGHRARRARSMNALMS
jgi:superfamily II DNA/RNA helicase